MQELKELLSYARQQIPELDITGLHYVVAPSQLRKGDTLCICFDAVTDNPLFFGREYSNSTRIKYLDLLYEKLSKKTESLGKEETFLDFYMHLEGPYKPREVDIDKKLTEGTVDVTYDNSVKFVNLAGAIHNDDIETGSAIDKCCSKYGITDVLMHGFHTIAPDPSTAEALEALSDAEDIKSVLEIGGGVGATGYAAMSKGITDFTFVDLNSDVCNYLQRKLPYKVVQSDALDFDFDRDYDAVVIGVPYELIPQIMEKKGREISDHAGNLIIQSGCTAFFQHEHDWVLGKDLSMWPWWKPAQTAKTYFPHGIEAFLGYQTLIFATHGDHSHLENFGIGLQERGALPVKYNHVLSGTSITD